MASDGICTACEGGEDAGGFVKGGIAAVVLVGGALASLGMVWYLKGVFNPKVPPPAFADANAVDLPDPYQCPAVDNTGKNIPFYGRKERRRSSQVQVTQQVAALAVLAVKASTSMPA
jgi:hypothetical protein